MSPSSSGLSYDPRALAQNPSDQPGPIHNSPSSSPGAGRRQHPAAQARFDAVRRERRLLRHRRAVERSRLQPSGEHKAERVLTWPLSTGLNLGWRYTPFQKAHRAVSVPLRRLRARHDHDEDFNVPSSTLTNGIGAAWEYRRGGYSLLMNGARFVGPHGRLGTACSPRRPAARQRRTAAYAKYTASLSRDFYFKVFHKIHLNGAWFGGKRSRLLRQVPVRHVR